MKSDILIDGSLFLADGNVDSQFVDLQFDSQRLGRKGTDHEVSADFEVLRGQGYLFF